MLPNFFHDSIPIGNDENDNKIIKIFNEKIFESLEIFEKLVKSR